MNKVEKLQGKHTVNDFWIGERLRCLMSTYGYITVNAVLHGKGFLAPAMLIIHLDNLGLTYGFDSVQYTWQTIFKKKAI